MAKITSAPASQIRPAHPAEANTVAELLRDAIPSAVRPLTAFGQHGAANWIRDRLRTPSDDEHGEAGSRTDPTILVTTTQGTVCGAAEWRWIHSTLFLNSISVFPSHQNQGRGCRLLHSGLLQSGGASRVALDVFDSNGRARSWYERLGFTPQIIRHWMVFPLDAGSVGTAADTAPEALLQNASAADAQHDRFGFSTLRFRIPEPLGPDTYHEVGRLGTAHFRITDASTLASSSIRAALLALNPSRSLLYLASDRSPSYVPSPTSELVECKAQSVRMRAPIATVEAELSSRCFAGP